MALPPTSPEEVLIAEAEEETLERIRRHRRKVRAQVKPLLEKIEERLLDAELTVEALRRWCEVNDKNVSTLFAQDLGLAPWDYITFHRMEVADRLLAGSDLRVWEIASIVGYGAAQSFSRAYRRLRGCSPGAYRRQARATRKSEPTPEAMAADPASAALRVASPAMASTQVELDKLARVIARELDPVQAAALLRRLDAVGRRMQQAWTDISLVLVGLQHLLGKEYRELGLLEPADSET